MFSSDSKYSKDICLSAVRSRSFFDALVFAMVLWVGDSLIDAWCFNEGTFAAQFWNPSLDEMYMRSLLVVLILTMGFINSVSIVTQRRQSEELRAQKDTLQKIVHSEPECVKTVAEDGTLLDMNPAGLSIVGAENLEQVRNQSVYDLIAPEDRDAYIEFNKRIFQGESARMEYSVLDLLGNRKRVDSHAVPLRDSFGEVVSHLAITRDISEFRRNQDELKQFSMAVEQCASMVMITNADGNITYVNPRFCEVTGFSADECIGRTPKILYSGHHEQAFYDAMWQQISNGQEWRGNVQNRRKNGDLYWASVVISPIKNKQDELIHYLCTQEDITDSHLMTQQLEFQARHCMLTGLINRYEFEQCLEQLLLDARGSYRSHAVLFLDVDQFKQVNDTAGHAAGDQILRQVGKLLKDHIRQHDLVARLGGDEFALLLEDCDSDQAMEVAEKIRTALEEYSFPWKEKQFKMTASIGIGLLDQYTVNVPTLLSQADSCCHMAKEKGRNRVCLHREQCGGSKVLGEIHWVSKIHQGLEEQRFCLYVQDIIGLKDGNSSRYEVLIRYIDDNGEIVPPGAFLPPAERYGLSPKIDRWVLDQVCQFLSEHPDKHLNLSVNLPGLSITEKDFLSYVIETIYRYEVCPTQLCFEITETATITNMTEAVDFIIRLKEVGCRFALDDFGSGLSSFGYLRTLPVDIVKIDGIFVKNIANNEIDREMVRSINEMAHLMGKRTVAEFVESEESSAILSNMNVDFAQGYGIARPHPIEQLLN